MGGDQAEDARAGGSSSALRGGTVLNLVLALNNATTFDEAFGLILDAALEVAPFDCGGIYVFDETGENLRLVQHRCLPQVFVDHVASYGPDTPQVARIRQNQAIFGRYEEIRAGGTSEQVLEGLLGLGVIPVSHRGVVVGTLNVGSHTTPDIPPEARQMLQIIAAHIGGVLARLRAETREKRAESNLRALFHTTEELIVVLSTKGEVLEVNDAVARLLGYSRDELFGKHVLELHPPEERDEVIRTVADMLSGRVKECLIPLVTKDGRHIPVETRVAKGIWNDADALFGISRDISERKKAEEERVRLATAIESAGEAVLIAGADAAICYANPAVEQVVGRVPSECLGRDLYDVILGDPGLRRSAREALRSGSAWATRAKETREDGSMRCSDVSVNIIRSPNGKAVNAVAVLHDITELFRMEQLLYQSRKMEAIGQFAAGIAHGLNNILAVILGHCELARPRSADTEFVGECLGKIESSARRAVKLVKEIRTFSRQSADLRRTMDIAALVRETVQIMKASLPPSVDVRFESKADFTFVQANSGQLQQVITNLCANAVDAMKEEGGILWLRVENPVEAPLQNGDGTIGIAPPRVCLSVQDTGCGMSESIMERIFDPFFTTKKWGQGTGLGLAIVHGIVAAHGGTINVKSAPGKGARFDVIFPVVASPAKGGQRRVGGSQLRSAPKPSEPVHVLLAEDERPVIEILSTGLRHYGYEVSSFEDPCKALEAFRASPSSFQIVVSDVLMPGMMGNQLALEILKISPATPVILCSGLNDVCSENEIRRMGVAAYLKKPFKIADLVNTIEKAISVSRVKV